MPWKSDGSFERVNPDFSGADVWDQDRQVPIKIVASRHDYHDQDLANGIAESLNIDGLNDMRAALKMGSYKITNIADATSNTDAPSYGQTAGSISFAGTTLTLKRRNGTTIGTAAIPISDLYKLDGSRPLTGNMDAGGKQLTNVSKVTNTGDMEVEASGLFRITSGQASLIGVYDGTRSTQLSMYIDGTTELRSANNTVFSVYPGGSHIEYFTPLTPKKVTTTQRLATPTPTAGMVVYDSTLKKLCVHNGTMWEKVTSSGV